MALSNLVTKQLYNGDGATTNFAIPFVFWTTANVKVYLVNAVTLVETLQTISTHYTITGASPGTTVVMNTAPTAAQKLLVKRSVPLTQVVDYIASAAFPSTSHEQMMDIVVAMAQELDEARQRTPKFRASASTLTEAGIQLPDPTANYVLIFNAGATGFDAIPQSALTGATGPTGPAGAAGPTGPAFLSLTTFGATPNTSGLTLSGGGTVLNAEPANASNPGMVSTATQIFGGLKKFANSFSIKDTVNAFYLRLEALGSGTPLTADRVLSIVVGDADRSLTFTANASIGGTNTGDVTLGAIGAAPNANGALLTGQALVLQPADATFGGVLTAAAQTIAGAKTFAANIITSTYRILSSATGLTARAGGGQALALQLAKEVNWVTTCATANDSVKLPVGVAGMKITIFNDGVASLDVFPATGENINALALNAAYAVTAGSSAIFYCTNTGAWKTFTGGAGGGSGVTTMTAFGAVPNGNGATIATTNLTLQPADGTNPGGVSIAAQTFGGAKTFASNVLIQGFATMERQDDAATTGANASVATPTKSFIKLTNGSLTSIDMIPAGVNGQLLLLKNGTGASISLSNDTGATAGNRIMTGTGISLTVANNATVLLAYDLGAARWLVVGGSAAAGPTAFGSRGTPRSVVAATGITSGASHMSTTADRQVVFVEGSVALAECDVSANPQISNHTVVGSEMTVIGRTDTQPVLLENGNGLSLNGPISLGADVVLRLLWDGTNWLEITRSN